MSEWTRERLDMAKSEPKRGAPWEVVGMGPARHVRTVEGKLLVMGPVNASPLDLEHTVHAVNEREDMLAEIERAWGEIERLTKGGAVECAECRKPLGTVAHADCDAPALGIVGRELGYAPSKAARGEPGAGSHADAADDAVATVYEQDAERERNTAVPERLTREEARERLRALGVAGPDALLDDAKGWIDRIARKKSKGQIAAILRAYVAGQDADTAKGLSEPARPSAWMQREAREGVRFAEAAVAAYESATPPAANRTGEAWQIARDAFKTAVLNPEDAAHVDRFSERVWRAVVRALSAPAAPALVFYRGDRVSHIQETPGKAWCGISLAHLEPEPDRTLDGRACKRCRALMPAAPAAPSAERDRLGRIVREVWIEWAREQPNPEASWLVPWEDMGEPEREVDRRIGERLAREGRAEIEEAHAALDPIVARRDARDEPLLSITERAATATRIALDFAARATPAPLTEAEAIAWGTRVAQALSHGPTVEALKQAWRREIPTWVRASRGDIPDDVRAEKGGGVQ